MTDNSSQNVFENAVNPFHILYIYIYIEIYFCRKFNQQSKRTSISKLFRKNVMLFKVSLPILTSHIYIHTHNIVY